MGLKGSAIELIAEKTSAILCIDYTINSSSSNTRQAEIQNGIKYYYLNIQKSSNVDFSYKALDEEQFWCILEDRVVFGDNTFVYNGTDYIYSSPD